MHFPPLRFATCTNAQLSAWIYNIITAYNLLEKFFTKKQRNTIKDKTKRQALGTASLLLFDERTVASKRRKNIAANKKTNHD